jgi:hypothetical protein
VVIELTSVWAERIGHCCILGSCAGRGPAGEGGDPEPGNLPGEGGDPAERVNLPGEGGDPAERDDPVEDGDAVLS